MEKYCRNGTRKVFILNYDVDTPFYSGNTQYFIIAKTLKQAKENVKHKFTNEKLSYYSIVRLNKKHQFHESDNLKLKQ